MAKLNEAELSALKPTIDSFVKQIISKGHVGQFLREPNKYMLNKLTIGKIIESIGVALVRARAQRLGATFIENARLQFIDKNGNGVGGTQAELDFMLFGKSGVVEIVSAKLEPKRVSSSQDLKNFSWYRSIPTKDVSQLRAYLKEHFGKIRDYDKAVDVHVLSSGGVESLESFRLKYIGADANPKVVGLTPKSSEFNTNGMQLDLTREELINVVKSMITEKLPLR